MKKIIVYLSISALFLTSVCLAYENPKETELLFMARKAYEDGFYEVSLGMLERFQKEYGNSSEVKQARLLSGQCYFQQGRYLESLNIFEGLFNDPECSSFKDALYFWMAEVHFKGSNFEKAAAFYQKLITEFPQSPYVAAAYYSLGWSLSQIGKYSQAVQTFKSLIEKFPGEPQSKDAAFKLIECLYNLKEYSELKNKIKPVLKLYVNDALRLPYLYFYLAESEYYLDNFDEAAKNYLKSAQASKEQQAQALAKLGLGWSYLKLAKYKEAEEILAEIKQNSLDKKSLDILILGQALLMSSTNRVYEAKKLYEQLIDISSDPLIRIQAYLGRADAFYNLTEYTQAVNVYKEGLDKIDKLEAQADRQISIPDELSDKLRYNLGLAYIKEGRVNLGIDIFEGISKKTNNLSVKESVLFQIAQAYQEANDFVKAEEAYAKILKLYPDSAYLDYAQYQLGSLQLKSLKYDQAINSFKLLLKNYPQSKYLGGATYSLGTAYSQKADYLASCQVFSKFQNEFKDDPLRPQAFYMLGTAFLSLGKINEALNVFKDILKLYPQDIELLQKTEYEIADCYYKLRQENEALRLFKLLRSKYPGSSIAADVLWWLGQYYYRGNDLELARRYFTSLAKDFPDSRLSAGAFYALGLTSYKLGDYKGAKLYYAKSLELAEVKDVANIRFNLAETLEANSEFDAAAKQYLLAADLYPQSPDLLARSLLRAAKLYEDKESFKQALEIYKRIIEQGGQEAKFAQERVEWINSKN
ncbi:MAG: tetratricopeptide repeat protein [Candidatus Omnitrophica bacterium]|nr:tetratricopeptide repeat protein [Candidatus Omnitrophota bacterium]